MGRYQYNLSIRFSEVVSEHGGRDALRFHPGHAVTYNELDSMANRTAQMLLERGVKRGDLVCICTDKTLVPYVVILASLKIGATYFAVDPRNPVSRISTIVEQCRPSIIFSDAEIDFKEYRERVIKCDAWTNTFPPSRLMKDEVPDPSGITGETPAYVMFTSGSTGTPKGAVMTHLNLLLFADWAETEYGFAPADCHTHLNPIYFDNSVFDIYSTFFTGGALVPFDTAMLGNPAGIAQRIQEMECTTWFSVPSLLMYLQVMKEVRAEPFLSLKRIIFGGEGYPKSKLKELRDTLAKDTQLINVYGPTECTCICSSHIISEADFDQLEGYPTLGHLIRNFEGFVLDGDIEVEDGEVGEPCLAGPCVGAGYFNQPEQTDVAFTWNPLVESHGRRIYRTGDLVRKNPETGKFDFAGRKDLQIKHQGYRIELEEIQHAINKVPGVDESSVLYAKKDGGGAIIAVVASRDGVGEIVVRQSLKDSVPGYMVPARYHIVDALPKNPNGKTDRKELERRFL